VLLIPSPSEYCARGSLRDVLKANPLMEWSTKVRLAFEAAKGLAFMHNRDPIYLHRDLKASNILVTEDWTAKISVCAHHLTVMKR
jgi:serine/threonine protein kinase